MQNCAASTFSYKPSLIANHVLLLFNLFLLTRYKIKGGNPPPPHTHTTPAYEMINQSTLSNLFQFHIAITNHMTVTNAAVNGFVQISILFVDANQLEKKSGSDPFYGGPVRQTDK